MHYHLIVLICISIVNKFFLTIFFSRIGGWCNGLCQNSLSPTKQNNRQILHNISFASNMPPASSSKAATSSVAPPSSFSSSASSSSSRASSELRELQSKFKKSLKTREYTSHSSKVHSVDWSCDGRRLASGSYDKTVCVFAMSQSDTKLSKETTFRGHSDSVDQASCNLNSKCYL